jgi:hypothetical protein
MTYLYSKINDQAFHDAFINMGRKDQFSYAGRAALFEHLEGLAEDMGEPIELDVIALCCDYSEDTLEAIKVNYTDIGTLDDLRGNTTVIMVDDADADNPTVIYQAF